MRRERQFLACAAFMPVPCLQQYPQHYTDTSNLQTWIQSFVTTYHTQTGRYPIIYSTNDWWTTCTVTSLPLPHPSLPTPSLTASHPTGRQHSLPHHLPPQRGELQHRRGHHPRRMAVPDDLAECGLVHVWRGFGYLQWGAGGVAGVG